MRIRLDGEIDGRYLDAQKRKRTIEEIRDLVKEKYDGDYTLITSEYHYERQIMKFHHKVCDKEIEMNIQYFLIGGGECPCQTNLKYNSFDTINRTKEKNNTSYMDVFLTNEKMALLPTTERLFDVYCTICNEKKEDLSMKQTINLYKVGCKCQSTKHSNTYSFRKDLIEKSKGEFGLISDFVNKKTKTLFYHKKCNDYFWASPSKVLKNLSCPYCRITSRGEDIISSWLNENNYNYEREKKFDTLTSLKNKKYKLRYDFFLPEYNLIIEFHGRQHFNIDGTGFYKNKSEFQYRQLTDKYKENWAITNGYEILVLTDYRNAIRKIDEFISYLS